MPYKKEVVKYHNNLSDLPLKNFNTNELNLFMTICHKINERGSNIITLKFDEIKSLSNYQRNNKKRFVDDLISMNKKLMNLNMIIFDGNTIIQFVLFPRFKIDSPNSTLEVSVADEFQYLFNDLVSNFSILELEEFVNLSSSYSKAIYRQLKRYKDTGIWNVTISNFRNIIDIPESYRMCDIDTRVLNPALSELNNYFKDLKLIKKHSKGRGNPVESLSFIFKKQVDLKTIENNKNIKLISNADKTLSAKSRQHICPECNQALDIIRGKNGDFWGHKWTDQGSGCKYTESLSETNNGDKKALSAKLRKESDARLETYIQSERNKRKNQIDSLYKE